MMTQITGDGSETSCSGSFWRMVVTVELGKHLVMALKNWTLRMMESPRIVVVGGKSGQGDGIEDERALDPPDGHSTGGLLE